VQKEGKDKDEMCTLLFLSFPLFFIILLAFWARYASRPILAKALFLYTIHVLNDVAKAAELATLALQQPEHGGSQWLWRSWLAFAYYRLNMMRDAEAQLRTAIKELPMVFSFHLLAKVVSMQEEEEGEGEERKKKLSGKYFNSIFGRRCTFDWTSRKMQPEPIRRVCKCFRPTHP
jgi:hypothetical protein